jgi:hypothetical protein
MYKQYKTTFGEILTNQIQRVIDNAVIPVDAENSDYQAYLKWLEEGNTLLPASE